MPTFKVTAEAKYEFNDVQSDNSADAMLAAQVTFEQTYDVKPGVFKWSVELIQSERGNHESNSQDIGTEGGHR